MNKHKTNLFQYTFLTFQLIQSFQSLFYLLKIFYYIYKSLQELPMTRRREEEKKRFHRSFTIRYRTTEKEKKKLLFLLSSTVAENKDKNSIE